MKVTRTARYHFVSEDPVRHTRRFAMLADSWSELPIGERLNFQVMIDLPAKGNPRDVEATVTYTVDEP